VSGPHCYGSRVEISLKLTYCELLVFWQDFNPLKSLIEGNEPKSIIGSRMICVISWVVHEFREIDTQIGTAPVARLSTNGFLPVSLDKKN
jgi:hypothetical protein